MLSDYRDQGSGSAALLAGEHVRLVRDRTDRSRIGFAALLKFFQVEGRFPTERREMPRLALKYLASQLEVLTAAVDNPDGVVKEVVYPVVGEQTHRLSPERSADRITQKVERLIGRRKYTEENS